MKNKHIITDRHKDISFMFLKMGKTLVDEGLKNEDYVTASVGSSMIFMSSVVFDIEETRQFSELCNMMSSRRLVKGLRDGSFDISKFGKVSDDNNDDPFQEMINQIRKDLRDDDDDIDD